MDENMERRIQQLEEELEAAREDKSAWMRAAQQLARDLGNIKYADIAYEDVLDNENGIPYA